MYKITEYLALAAVSFFIQTESIATDKYGSNKYKESWFGFSTESSLEQTISNKPNTQKVSEIELYNKTFSELRPAKPILNLEQELGLSNILDTLKPKFVYSIRTKTE